MTQEEGCTPEAEFTGLMGEHKRRHYKKRKKKKESKASKRETKMEVKILKEIKKMAQTLQDLQAIITRIRTAVTANTAAVDADVEQTAKVVAAVDALIAKIEASGNTDFTAEVEALSTATAEMENTTTKLASDNAGVQAAIDKAVPPVV